MSEFKKNNLFSFFKGLDKTFQNYVDKIFPQNLTVRYILGLTIIGALSLAGHLVIQLSLVKLESDEKMIRLIENQSDDSERFYREIIHLQTISREADFHRQVETLDKDIVELIEQHKEIMERMNSTYWYVMRFPRDLEQFKTSLVEAFDQLDNVFGKLGSLQYLDDPSLRISDPLVISFIKTENHYRDILDQLTKKYEKDTHEAVDYFYDLETTFLLITFLVLILEGLYVFRPAVKRVYSSIQLRTDFLSRMSHEIRNPMNSIIGMTQMLGKTRPNQQQKSYIKILENSSLGLLEMLNNLLDFSAIESGKLKVENVFTDIYNVLEKAVDLVTIKIQEKNLEFILDIDPDVPLKIDTDPVRLQQVLVNLLSNSAKFTERGFVILKVNMLSTGNAKRINFAVIDSGIGIEESKVESIFESFVQENSSVKRKYGGTGLGLTIAKEIVALLKGHIQVETKKGFGSTFSFHIPCETSQPTKLLTDFIPVKLTDKKYLLIDQSEKSTECLKNLIVSQGATCEVYKQSLHFDEMIRFIKANSFEKIILDTKTFGTKLEDFLIYLRQSKVDLRSVCIIFGYIHTNYLFSLLTNYGINSFFPKPIKPIEFINYLSGHAQDTEPLVNDENTVLTSERRYKILIAEDSADNRLLLQLFLEKYPVDIYFAENGKVAVDLFKQQKFDIVFMDIQMPEMDGITATKIIREIEKDESLNPLSILAFTAHKPEEILNEGEDKLFSDFVLKPITVQKLKQKLTQYLKFTEVQRTTQKQNTFDVSDLIPAYLERRTQELSQMNDLMARSDLKTLGRIGHQLKGSAKSYGFEELGALGGELEKVSQEGQMDLVKSIVEKISLKITEYRKHHLN
jgi:two-component system sensor histidine kinase/response regulator